MTNIIKIPIQKIRRKGPNGEFTLHWDDVKETIERRICANIEIAGDYILHQCFHIFGWSSTISSDESNEKWSADYMVMLTLPQTGEVRMFELKRLMPELECW